MSSPPRVVVAPDKFRGTATASELVAAASAQIAAAGATVVGIPLADGGEGTLEALGGANRTSTVTGPLGDPVEADWRLARGTAVIEMARASGLLLAGGRDGNDPLTASTAGTGELIDLAVDRGATRVVVGVGGSATTDGGLGALRAMHPLQRFRGVEIIVACDVETLFTDAPAVFGPQKGATPAQIKLLEGRLERLAQVYLEEHGVDVLAMARSGAAGGLAGGLAAIGADLVNGFDVVADEADLAEHIEASDLIITGEGKLDDQSFEGKVVGGVAALAAEVDTPVVAIAGMVELSVAVPDNVTVISLTDRFGVDASMHQTVDCFARVVAEVVASGA